MPDPYEISATLCVASLGGAMVYCFVRPDRENWMRSLASIAGGTAIGIVVAPAISEHYVLDSVHTQHAVALLCGLLGMTVAKSAVQSAESELAKQITDAVSKIIRRILGIAGEPKQVHRPDSDVNKI